MLSGGGGMSDEGVGLSCQPVTGPEQLLLTGTLFLSAQGEILRKEERMSSLAGIALMTSFTCILKYICSVYI